MISFYRKIRERLLDARKFRRYLIYAIGEIVLVVIGILIALQINNWNEIRKDRLIENQILVDLKKSLNSDIENQFYPNITEIIQDISNMNSIIESLENKVPYNDSLSSKFRSLMFSKTFTWEITAYKNLENEGLNIISNPELKDKILRLYNTNYPGLQSAVANFGENLIEFNRPEMRTKFRFHYTDNRETFYIPVNYEKLVTDTIFMNTLLTTRLNFLNIHETLNDTKYNVDNLIADIDEALKNK